MKFLIYIVLTYLFVLTALPSVRALKVLKGNSCESSCSKSEEMECETAKFVMSLNFSPVQFVKEIRYFLIFEIPSIHKKEMKSFYKLIFKSYYQNSIWHPPKHLL